ncbi:cysteine peptidase family C39 domain-containing protein [Legionella sp.]|uniref:cysteine peptidase family C39 domain-containing protein n=1 Tax=Legionella sp. TaxID=459 RepID=UPI000CB882B8|nr:cysteine peptidase family C39 domain-containing protein [Legionella sp.]PJE16637.1 MAG: ATPase [Legionella sp.]
MIKFDFDQGLMQVHHKRVKTPSILQMDVMECGAVCLSIILAYYGLHISSETAREACGVTRDGSKAINIIKAARNLGMKAEGKRIKDIDSLGYLPTPFIVFWKFEHFIVIEGIIKNKIYINDPATGPRVITLNEFNKGYTGVVLSIRPGEEFKPSGKKEKSVFGLLRDYLKGDFIELSYLLFASALLSIPQASLALFIEFFVDNIIIKNQEHWMLGFTLSMAFTIACMIFLLWVQQYYLVLYKIRFSIKKIPEFFNTLLHLPMSFYIQRSTGDISNRLYIFDEIAAKITEGFSEGIMNSLSIIIYTLIILLINKTIGLITILITIINFAAIIITKRLIIDLGRRFSQDQAKMHSIEYSGVQMMEALKFMNGENRFFLRWLSYKSKLIDSQQKIDLYTSLISLLPSVLYFLNLVLLIILGAHFVMQGTMTVGGVIAIYTLLLLYSGPVIGIVENFLKINELKGDLLRVNDVLQYKTRQESSEIDQIKSTNLVDIKEVYFGYCKLEAPILTDINIALKKGNKVAITGMSGGGKSSLFNLITGLYEPWFGNIYLSGKNIKNYSSDELFKLISYVDQNIFLFEGTIRDNLTMWDRSVDDKTIVEALKTACIYDAVAMKGGLDYRILEGGSNISLGQAQRIEIARALIKQPQLILLDEATSALDSVTEAQIYKNLGQINCSFFIVAHRLSAIKHCNEIIVIEDGSIIERGTHEELLQLDGRYRQFIEKDYLL